MIFKWRGRSNEFDLCLISLSVITLNYINQRGNTTGIQLTKILKDKSTI